MLALSCLGIKGVKSKKITWVKIYPALVIAFVLFFLNTPLLKLPSEVVTSLYIFTTSLGYIALLINLMDDVFNNENESFQQENSLIENEYSVNLTALHGFIKPVFKIQDIVFCHHFCLFKIRRTLAGCTPVS